MKRHEELINIYVKGFNDFNMKKMLLPLHSKIVFENHVKDELTMKLEGVKAFKKQAQKGFDTVSKRRREILSIEHKEEYSETITSYTATMKVDIGEQMKKGEVITLTWKSKFFFKDDRISRIEDYS